MYRYKWASFNTSPDRNTCLVYVIQVEETRVASTSAQLCSDMTLAAQRMQPINTAWPKLM